MQIYKQTRYKPRKDNQYIITMIYTSFTCLILSLCKHIYSFSLIDPVLTEVGYAIKETILSKVEKRNGPLGLEKGLQRAKKLKQNFTKSGLVSRVVPQSGHQIKLTLSLEKFIWPLMRLKCWNLIKWLTAGR